MTRRNYSRLARIEEKKNMRSALVFGLLSISILAVFFFFGLPALAKFVGSVSDIGSSNNPIEINDTTPPAPPQLDPLPEYTDKDKLTVNGTTEAGATVKIIVNGSEDEIVSDSEGRFTLDVKLSTGDNNIKAVASDQSGNISSESEVVTVVFDSESPDVEITSPQEGQSFAGSKQKNITVEGKTDPESDVSVNGKLASINDDGVFKVSIELGDGENPINIKSKDRAGNETEKTISVTYTP